MYMIAQIQAKAAFKTIKNIPLRVLACKNATEKQNIYTDYFTSVFEKSFSKTSKMS